MDRVTEPGYQRFPYSPLFKIDTSLALSGQLLLPSEQPRLIPLLHTEQVREEINHSSLQDQKTINTKSRQGDGREVHVR